MRDVIERYLVAGNRVTTVDSSSRTHEILHSAVVALAHTFESFVNTLPDDSTEKMLLENSTRVVMEKVKRLDDSRE